MKTTVRGPLATLALVLLVGAAVAFVSPRLATDGSATPAPSPPPAVTTEATAAPEPADAPDADAERAAEDALLRERLGALAALVVTDDPLIESCATPRVGGVPGTTGAVPDGDDVDAVVAAAETLRGLELDDPVRVELLDAAAMAAEVEERFARRGDPEQVDVETRALTALGAITADTDLAALRVDAFAEQVSGLHSASDSLVLLRVEDDERLSPLERTVLAHEIEHALTFQHLGRPRDHREGRGDADTRLASLAVTEGSATLVMLQYARAVLDADEQETLRAELLDRARDDALAGYTPYLLAELRFPYTAGLRDACARWLDGGWEAVDAAYTEPPVSTAAVLDPSRGADPRDPAPLGALGEPWERAEQRAFGAAELRWLLAAPDGDREAAVGETVDQALAWAGGRLEVWTRGEDTAVGLALVDRADGRQPPLCTTIDEWYAAAFPGATRGDDGGVVTFTGAVQDAALVCDGDEVRLGIAPEDDEARRLARVHQN